MTQVLGYDSEACSIARATQVFGDRWSLLVIRDVLNGVRRFADLADHLGVSREVLSRRLATLVESGILVRREYREPGSRARHEYRLTTAGRELVPVLVALLEWGDRHLADQAGPPWNLEHRDCGAQVHSHLVCESGHDVDPSGGVRLVPASGARLRRG